MKNRIVSCLLAVLMVVSMVAVFTVSSSAEVEGLKVVVGTAYGVPGEEVEVDIYVAADSLGDYVLLRDWQFTFSGATIVGSGNTYVTSDNDPKAFTNTGKNEVGCSTNKGSCVASKDAILTKGGAKIASIAFNVPEDAQGEIAVTISDITSLNFETASSIADEKASATIVAGKIIPYAGETNAPAVEGKGEDFSFDAITEDGKKITKITKANKLSGTFANVNLPSTITSIAGAALTGTFDSFNIKSTNLDKSSVAALVEKAESTIYYCRRADGTDTTYDTLVDYIENESNNEPELKNILNAASVENGSKVTVLASIVAPDLDFTELTITAVNENGKVYEATTKNVASTVAGVASADAATASTNSLLYVEATYLAGLTLNNVPAGSHSLKVTIYATSADANGNDVVLCSDVQTVNFTVEA